MSGIGGAMDIGKLSMLASQSALQVVSNNIANANTVGYSKQNVTLRANTPINTAPGAIGTGVRATEVTRQYNLLFARQANEKESDYQYWSTQSTVLQQVETIFNESNETGLSNMLSEFWSAWSDLSNNPDGTAERESLLAQSENLVKTIQDMAYNLRMYQSNLNSNIQNAVGEVNSLLSQIADLNTQITNSEVDGQINANTLRDNRDALVKKLSQYMDVSYYEEAQTGQYMVYVNGGTPLVLGSTPYSLGYERNSTTGNTDVIWNGQSGQRVNLTNRLKGGKIAGWISVRDTRIGGYLDSLNTMAKELTWQVNSRHAEGTGLASVSTMTGTELITDADAAIDGMDVSGNYHYSFGDRFTAGGSFDIVTYDANGTATRSTITLNAGATVNDLINAINTTVPHMNASVNSDSHLELSADSGYTFAVTSASSGASNNALGILGVNTFFSWNAQDGDFTQTMAVNGALQDDTDLIAAGKLDSNNHVAVGDNRNALAIYNLQDMNVEIDGSRSTIDAYYSSIVSQVGIHSQNAQSNESYNSSLLDEYTTQLESITGVNLDDEMVDLLKFQRSYQAAAKLISIADEMLETLISMLQ